MRLSIFNNTKRHSLRSFHIKNDNNQLSVLVGKHHLVIVGKTPDNNNFVCASVTHKVGNNSDLYNKKNTQNTLYLSKEQSVASTLIIIPRKIY
jgi:hypothetical protein